MKQETATRLILAGLLLLLCLVTYATLEFRDLNQSVLSKIKELKPVTTLKTTVTNRAGTSIEVSVTQRIDETFDVLLNRFYVEIEATRNS